MSLVTNTTTEAQQSGQADTLVSIRFTASKVMNAGSAWAGLGVLAGWLVPRPVQAAAAGIVAFQVALVAHYGLGRAFGMFDADVWASNSSWFLAAAVLGVPLGLVGTIARRTDLWGLTGRLLIPVGAVLEPFALGMFTSPAIMPWPDRASSVAAGIILLSGGATGGAAIMIAAKKHGHAHR